MRHPRICLVSSYLLDPMRVSSSRQETHGRHKRAKAERALTNEEGDAE